MGVGPPRASTRLVLGASTSARPKTSSNQGSSLFRLPRRLPRGAPLRRPHPRPLRRGGSQQPTHTAPHPAKDPWKKLRRGIPSLRGEAPLPGVSATPPLRVERDPQPVSAGREDAGPGERSGPRRVSLRLGGVVLHDQGSRCINLAERNRRPVHPRAR